MVTTEVFDNLKELQEILVQKYELEGKKNNNWRGLGKLRRNLKLTKPKNSKILKKIAKLVKKPLGGLLTKI